MFWLDSKEFVQHKQSWDLFHHASVININLKHKCSNQGQNELCI